jgi:hypothetical protein
MNSPLCYALRPPRAVKRIELPRVDIHTLRGTSSCRNSNPGMTEHLKP